MERYLVVFLSFLSVVDTQTFSNMDTLVTSLLTGYKKDIRPLKDQSEKILLSVYMAPGAIIKFRTMEETISMTTVVVLSWHDENINWTPSLHGDINSVYLSQNLVWYPKLILADPADEMKTLGQSLNTMVEYNSTGHATFTIGCLLESLCEVDVTDWPFDTQECEIRFVPLVYDNRTITMTAGGVYFVYFTENGEFEIQSTLSRSYILGVFPVASFTFTLKRRSTFLLVNVILPVIFLMILSVFVFFLPAESGERVGYSLSVLLAISVFFGTVNQFLPTTSKSISNLTYYLMINFVISTCICIATMISLRLHAKTEEFPVPDWLRRCFSPCSPVNDVSPEKTEIVSFGLQDIHNGDESQKTSFDNGEFTWKHVAKRIDKFLFISFSMAIIVTILWGILDSVIK